MGFGCGYKMLCMAPAFFNFSFLPSAFDLRGQDRTVVPALELKPMSRE
jgi:hypothetical protein